MAARAPSYSEFYRRLNPDKPMTLGQRATFRVAFDGAEPCALPDDERECAREIWGPVDAIPPVARTVFNMVKGRRVGGTYHCALRSLHLGLTVNPPNLADGERLFGLFIGPDMRVPHQALRYIEGAIQRAPELRAMLIGSTRDSLTLRRKSDGREVVFECMPATKGGSAVRGRSLHCAHMTEAGIFRDQDYNANGAEVVAGARPGIVTGGQMLLEGTPYLESGIVWDLHSANWGDPKGAMSALCPTPTMRPDARTLAIVEAEKQRDEANYLREFMAQFMSGGAGLLFDARAVEQSEDETLVFPEKAPDCDRILFAGDFGFKSDACALVGVAKTGDRLTLIALDEVKPKPGAPLKPREIAARFAAIMARFGCRSLVTDGFYSESTRENLADYKINLTIAPGGQVAKATAFLKLKEAIHEGRFRMPPNPILKRQLKEVVYRPVSGGGIDVQLPRRKGPEGGGHCDAASSLALAVRDLSEASTMKIHKPRRNIETYRFGLGRGF